MATKNEITQEKTEKAKTRPAPKKFLFDFAENLPKRNECNESFYESENLELEAYIPLILGFDPPQDYKKAYESISDYVVRTFNEIHQLVFTGFSESLPEVFGNIKTAELKDCVKFLREVIISFCKKQKKMDYEKSLNNDVEEYEKLLQKAEIRVRDLIRNEQIYRISFDQFTYRHEETEKTMSEVQNKLKEKKAQIEALTQESSKLTSLIQLKEEEIKTIMIQAQIYSENTPSALTKANSQPDASSLDQQKAKLRTLNLQNLKVLLNTNKATPLESSRLTPSVDSTRGISTIKKSARGASPTLKPKSLERGERSIGSGAQLVLKLGNGEKLKEMGNALKHRIEILTERRKLDLSAEIKMNNSDYLTDNFNFNIRGAQNGSISQICAQEQTKNKLSPKKLVKYDSFKEESTKSIHSARLKTYDEGSSLLYKAEPVDLYEVHSATLANTERKKKESMHQKLQSKRGEYQLLNTTRETKSGISKVRPIMTELESNSQDRSTDFRNMILKNKQLAYGISNNKNTSKDKSLRLDTKDSKMSPNNPVFMNIMLKKLGGQKSKKAL